jgi:hypothetical protein
MIPADAIDKEAKIAAFNDEIRKSRERIEEYNDIIKNVLKVPTSWSAKIGRAVFRASVGREGFGGGDTFDIDVPVEGLVDGITQALIVKGTKKVTDAVGEKVGTTITGLLSKVWDPTVNYVSDMWSDLCTLVFYGNNDPFTIEELQNWKDHIIELLKELEDMLKSGIKDSLRGLDTTMRQDEIENVQSDQHELNVWDLIANGYADQLQFFIEEVKKRKECYKDSIKLIYFYSQRLEERLLVIKNLLLSTKSLRELDAKLDSNKAIIPALRRNIESIFRQMVDVLKGGNTLNKDSSLPLARDVVRRDEGRYGAYGAMDNYPDSYWQ